MKNASIILFIFISLLFLIGCTPDIPDDTDKPDSIVGQELVETVITWYGISDEPMDPSDSFVESCYNEIEEVESTRPGVTCEVVSEACFDEDECLAQSATEMSFVGCCKCEIECYENDVDLEGEYLVVVDACYECLGCGCELVIFGEISDEKYEETYSFGSEAHANYGIIGKCLEGYDVQTKARAHLLEDLNLGTYSTFILTENELREVKLCVEELKKDNYCATSADCCEDLDCDYEIECVNNKCEE